MMAEDFEEPFQTNLPQRQALPDGNVAGGAGFRRLRRPTFDGVGFVRSWLILSLGHHLLLQIH
jgi:hypothetical protein